MDRVALARESNRRRLAEGGFAASSLARLDAGVRVDARGHASAVAGFAALLGRGLVLAGEHLSASEILGAGPADFNRRPLADRLAVVNLYESIRRTLGDES